MKTETQSMIIELGILWCSIISITDNHDWLIINHLCEYINNNQDGMKLAIL